MKRTCDALVVGGGPAGVATAMSLTRLGRSVVVLERSRYDRPRAGETFGGDLGPLLQALGAWEDFLALSPVPFRGVVSAWGGASLAERSSIFHPFGDGWHVDRARFDRMLARCAERAGVVVLEGAGASGLDKSEGLWHAKTATGDEVTGRFLVDASGRGAPATAIHVPERRWLRMDRQIALFGAMTHPSAPPEPVLLLEAVEDGWWYSVPQPGGALLVVLVTDGDLLPARGRAALARHYSERLLRSVHTSGRAAGARLAGPPWIARCDSGLLVPDRGPAFRAVGDAAMACDPLAGDGVVRALRAGLEAAPEIGRALQGPLSAVDGGDALRALFREYLEARGRYYASERRWPTAPFWARRRPVDWRAAPILLGPYQALRAGAPPTPTQLAPIEALLPPPAVRAVLERVRRPCPAHEALSVLRETAPLEDQRLLVGLQYLVHSGCVLVDPA